MGGMTRYADPGRCPDCSATIEYGAEGCASCGLPLRGPMAQELYSTLSRADELLAQLRSRAAATVVAPPVRPVPQVPPFMPPPLQTAASQTRPSGMRGASVPTILLGLGAGCLLVAALVFLAVAWSVMGVAGRTATLLAITALSGLVTAVLARRALRGAVEALGLVTLGLAALDLSGARHAGWLGDITDPGFAVLLGTFLTGVATAACTLLRRTPAAAFVSGEVVAALGVAVAAAGLTLGAWGSVESRLLVATLAALGATAAADRLALRVEAVGGGLVTLVAWLSLTLSAFIRILDNPTVRSAWGELNAWPALAAAALAAVAAAAPRLPLQARQAAASVAVAVATGVAVAPMADEAVTPQALVAVVVLTASAAWLWWVAAPWRAAAALTLSCSGVAVGGVAGLLFALALGRLADAAVRHGAFLDRLPEQTRTELQPWLLPLATAALVFAAAAVLRSFAVELPWRRRLTLTTLAVVTLTAALYPLPVWIFVAMGLAAGTGFLLRGDLVVAVVSVGAALVVAAHSDGLTAVALAVLMAAAVRTYVVDTRLGVREAAAAAAQFAIAASVWTWGELLDVPGEWGAAVGLLIVGALPLARRSVGLEIGGAFGIVGLFVAGGAAAPADALSTWLAVYLTLAGAAVCALSLLRIDRRDLGWVGGLLLAAATWVRLADLGIREPEPYTLPSALALLVVGLVHLRRNPGASTLQALGPGLGLALLPSLVWVLAEPATLRAVLLGLSCLALVLTGIGLRWSAPLVYGATIGGIVVLRHAAPSIADADVPRWVLIGFAGVLLVSLGVTWESRVREAQAMAGYVRRLR